MGNLLKNLRSSTPKSKTNWYFDRYQTVVVQRDIAVLITLISLGCILLSVTIVHKMSTSKSVEPFVIEIEERSGISNVVRPFLKYQITPDDAINHYFLVKYVRAREEYHKNTFKYNSNKLVHLFSDNTVYQQYRSFLARSSESPTKLVNKDGEITIKIISISNLEPPKERPGSYLAQVRFKRTIYDTKLHVSKFDNSRTISKTKREAESKVAYVNYEYRDMQYTGEDRYINPRGFRVISYEVEDEKF